MKNYALRFIAAEKNKVEEQFFSTNNEVLKEYANLCKDNSSAYSLVALFECTSNTLLHLLQFEDGQLQIDLAGGYVVGLREGYYENNENTIRFLIFCINSSAAIPAAESMDVKMVYTVEY